MFYDLLDGRGRSTLWFGRHHHRSGPFGRGFMGLGRGRGGFRTGRKLAAIDLQLLILALLAERPSHGYELIKALDERSGGFYSPSPGMVYPALTYLEEIGHATVEDDGVRKRYHITEQGRAHLQANREAAAAMLAELTRVGQRMERVRRAFGDEPLAEEERRGSSDLHAARQALKHALRERARSAEDDARIAEILRRATAAILGQ